ncbi:PEP-CTERM/exosortase system-associated acyltransferase [Rheinheimera maricola]|uniref:PEP-CTERM/exosortase system-associated acyltransferase n=1 Tax=Rheinheimera maricola TaxID=2793282 RepID=A0ABS7X878_9GAMM|nr:PEP-CTERM/exosortase system-associated acyltransferase [Rheinheimera maricola]MBZ9611756.1 PEP-CTERM/exosortase system-associated acyltransferase [Rheinheimera maricola]
MDCGSLAENFNLYFEIKFAGSTILREESFRIRHAVYCDELGWEPRRENGMETDECDDYAFALLLLHKRTGQYAGTARLVIPPPDKPDSKLPFESHCMESVNSELIDLSEFRRGSFSEISRLAVPEAFRRRLGEKNIPYVVNEINLDNDVFSEEERRNFPNIAIGLYLSIIALTQMCHHRAMFVVVEPRLKKRLERLGLAFEQIGEEMDYHGTRALFYLPEHKFTSALNPEVLELFHLLKQQLAPQLLLYPYLSKDKG